MKILRLAQSLGSNKGGGTTPVAAGFTFSVNTANAGSASNQFKLPLVSQGTISIDVDWGDGTSDTITTYNQAETLHTYASSGTYIIVMTNEVRGFKFANGGDKLKILNISAWGEFNVTDIHVFRGCTNLTSTATDAPQVGAPLSPANLNLMFYQAINWNGPMDNWDMVNVTGMSSFLRQTNAFNVPINNWNVSNVTNFNSCFNGAINFNQPLNLWNVSSVTNMSYMFNNCPSFDQDISDWDISSVVTGSNFLASTGTGLSTANYDALLIGWLAKSPTSNVTWNFGDSKYTAGGTAAAARASLISTYNWTITDGGTA